MSGLYSSPTLCDWTLPMVRLACDRCGRRGQYWRDTLIEKYGMEIPMPDLRHLIAQCPCHEAPGQSCGVYYADLKTTGHLI
jgi:hypothetical protein